MSKTISRRTLLTGGGAAVTAAALSSVALAEAPFESPVPPLRPADFVKRTVPAAELLLEQAQLSGQVGFVVADARTGLILEQHNPDLMLPPGSVTKTITTAYALASLGGAHRFSTRLLATGPVSGGRIQGDLVLVGGGDPTLDTDGLAEMAKRLRAEGITGLTGRFLIDAAALPYIRSIDPAQPEHLGYNPAISGLNLNYNRVHFEWKRTGKDYAIAMDARSKKYRPEVTTARMKIVNRDLPVYTYKAVSGVDSWTVARGALGNGGGRWLPMRRPDLYAADVFRVLARQQGVTLPKPAVARRKVAGTEIIRQDSAPLTDVLKNMLKYSTNLTAEVVGLSATAARGGATSNLSVSAQTMTKWAAEKFGTTASHFADHSGLSDATRMSAGDMTRILLSLGPDHALHGLMKEIVPRGRDGKKQPGAAYQIRAKTGTLNFVSALSGFITTADGNDLVFAIFTGDMKKRKAIKRADRERPAGGRVWNKRSRGLQYQLINRWALLYGD